MGIEPALRPDGVLPAPRADRVEATPALVPAVARPATADDDRVVRAAPARAAPLALAGVALPEPTRDVNAMTPGEVAAATPRLDPAAISGRVARLNEAFQNRDRDAVKLALHGVAAEDRLAIISAFNRDPANRPALGVRQDFASRARRLGLTERDRDWDDLMRSEAGRNDDVSRLHRSLSASSLDRETVLSLYRTRDAAGIAALESGYNQRHGGNIRDELTRRFGDDYAARFVAARLGSDRRRPEHDVAASLIDAPRGELSLTHARILGETLAAGRMDEVRRAVGELAPGTTLESLVRAPNPARSPNMTLGAADARIEAALANDRVGYVAASVQGLVRGGVSVDDARRALGTIDGRAVTWAAVEQRAQEGITPPIRELLQRAARGDSQLAAIIDRAVAGLSPSTANGADEAAVRAAALADAIDRGWFASSYRRRLALTDVLDGIPADQRAAVEQAYRANNGGRPIEAALRDRFSGVELERALSDWSGQRTAAQTLYFASQGQATAAELAREVARMSLAERARFAATYDAAYPGQRSGDVGPYQAAVARLQGADGEASRVFQAMVAAGELATPGGLERLQERTAQFLRDNRWTGWGSASRFLTDNFHYSGPQLDGSGRELLTAIERARALGDIGPRAAVSAEVREAHAAFVRDYARYLRDKGETAEVAAALAGSAAFAVATMGFGVGAVPATLVGVGSGLATRSGLDPAYADTVPNRGLEIAGSATAQVAFSFAGAAVVARVVPASAFSTSTLGSNGANLFANAGVVGSRVAVGETIDLSRVGASTAGVYLARKAPWQVEPGTRVLSGVYVNDIGQVQPWRAYYDGIGRMVGRTDYNARNTAAGIPEIHYHRYVYTRGGNRLEIESHVPGEFPGFLH